jgi:hypothetical protein
MDRADLRLAIDIAAAAAKAGTESILIKVSALPSDPVRLVALLLALEMVATKAASLRSVVPLAEEVSRFMAEVIGDRDADDLRDQLNRAGPFAAAAGS